MASYYIRDCGHKTQRDMWGKQEDEKLAGLCQNCKSARIGETIDFLRFGVAPSISTNHRDGTAEDGISVYEIKNGTAELVGWHFDFLSRPAFRGTGQIVGWGSDGEPLVRIIKIGQISASQKAKLTK